MSEPNLQIEGNRGRPSFVRMIMHERRLLLLGLCAVCLWIMAYVGLEISYVKQGKETSFSGLFYLAAQMLIINTGLEPGPENLWLSLARLMAPILLLVTAGEVFVRVFHREVQHAVIKWLYRGHVVICGLDRKSFRFAQEFIENGDKVVIIERDDKNVRLERCRELGARIITEDPKDPTALKRAKIQSAGKAVIVSDDEGDNSEIFASIRELLKERAGTRAQPLSCILHVASPHLCRLLWERKREIRSDAGMELELFNMYERGARMMLNQFPPFGRNFRFGFKSPHMLVIGLGHMGESLVLQAYRESRIRAGSSTSERLRVTILDREAKRKVELLLLKQPQLSRGCDLRCHDIDIESLEFEQGGVLLNADDRPNSVYVCLSDESLGMRIALTIHEKLNQPDMSKPDERVPIVVRIAGKVGLGALLPTSGEPKSRFAGIRGFSLIENTCKAYWAEKSTPEMVARAMHHSYLWSMVQSDKKEIEKPNLVIWEELSEKAKWSNMAQAAHIDDKLKHINCKKGPLSNYYAEPSFHFSEEELNKLAILEHERWISEKTADGWKFGDLRDEKGKFHPDMVPWERLKDQSKEYNLQSVKLLPALLATVDLEIVRNESELMSP